MLTEYRNIFDSHTHYDSDAYDEDRDELLDSLFEKGIIAAVNCGSDLKTSRTSQALSRKYDKIYFAAGVHPHEASAIGENDFDEIKKLLNDPKCVAIGEIGLDYHYDFSPRETQIEVFEYQLKLAKELDMPVVIHNREAHQDTWELLKKYKPKGVVHCFSGSVEMAKDILSIGMYIGLGGATTFKNAKTPVAVAKMLPDDRLLIETDCPYMTPVPHRGERNDSSYIPYIAELMAEVRGVTAQEILDMTAENAKRLFFK